MINNIENQFAKNNLWNHTRKYEKNPRSFTKIYRAMTVQIRRIFFQTFRRDGNAHKKI
jgi:hypothetical protein